MPRPRTHAPEHVIRAVEETFWQRGYEGTTVSALEDSTRLNRSSLYLHFGSKRSLFNLALDRYMDEFMYPLVDAIAGPTAGLEGIISFFSTIEAVLLDDLDCGRRGCFMVNALAGPSGHNPATVTRGAAYWERLRQAFADSLRRASARGEVAEESVVPRAQMLTAATFGVWLSARIDARQAAGLCAGIATEVGNWRSAAS